MGDSDLAVIKHYNAAIDQFGQELKAIMVYQDLKDKMGEIDVMSGPGYMRDFEKAYDKTNDLLAKIGAMYETALLDVAHEEAKAKFERATDYFKEKGILVGNVKDSAALRESYLPLDELYMAAKEKVAALKALKKWLENMLESFKMAHDDAKAIYRQYTSGPSGRNGYEGIKSG